MHTELKELNLQWISPHCLPLRLLGIDFACPHRVHWLIGKQVYVQYFLLAFFPMLYTQCRLTCCVKQLATSCRLQRWACSRVDRTSIDKSRIWDSCSNSCTVRSTNNHPGKKKNIAIACVPYLLKWCPYCKNTYTSKDQSKPMHATYM